jgi:hypothetical protein
VNTSPSRWHYRLLSVVVTLFVAALLLDAAIKLVLTFLPTLLLLGGPVAVAFVAWRVYQNRRSGW